MDFAIIILGVLSLGLSALIFFLLKRDLRPTTVYVKEIRKTLLDSQDITENIPDLIARIEKMLLKIEEEEETGILKVMTWTSSFGRIHTYNWRVSQSFASTIKHECLDEQLFKKGVVLFNKKLNHIDKKMIECARNQDIKSDFLFYDPEVLPDKFIDRYLEHQTDLQHYKPFSGEDEARIKLEYYELEGSKEKAIRDDIIQNYPNHYFQFNLSTEYCSEYKTLPRKISSPSVEAKKEDGNNKEDEIPIQLYLSKIPETTTDAKTEYAYQTLAIYAVDIVSDKEETRKLIGIYSKSPKMYHAFNTFFDLPFKK